MGQMRAFVPVKENHLLSGIPVHLSSVDLKEIRKNLFGCKPIMEYFDLESDDAIFFTCARVFPMPSTVASVWLFLGVEMPLPEETVYALAKEQQRQIQQVAESRLLAAEQRRAKKAPKPRDDDSDSS